MSSRFDELDGPPPRIARDTQTQIDQLIVLIDRLTTRADRSEMRADDAELRADAMDVRADAMDVRADAMDARADASEARSAVDREMLAELQAEGVVHDEQVQQLERALVTARVIGAAIGILMESRKVSQDEAFAMLREASSRANRSIRKIAAAIVEGADALG